MKTKRFFIFFLTTLLLSVAAIPSMAASGAEGAPLAGGIAYYTAHPLLPVLSLGLLIALVVLLVLLNRRSRQHDEEISELQKQLDAANLARSSFLFNMSHDIRTPMNAILGFTDIALDNLDNREKLGDCLKKTKEAGNILLALINSILEMSRIESGLAELDMNAGDIRYCFDNFRDTMQDMAAQKGISLSFEFGSIQDYFVYADFHRCMRIFMNIVSNSIQYTPNGGWIRVRCEQIGRENDIGFYCYTFSDNGIGMSEEFQEHLYDEFAREYNSTTSGVEGSGLGLSVVKSFVELMGGTIECKSAQGKGTTFTVTLPFRLQTDEKTVQYVDPKTKETVLISNEIPEVDEKRDFSGKRILMVEDNELNREIASYILSEENFLVEEADDGTTAVKLLKEKGPNYYDAILMDIQMPIMNGHDATKAIREMYPDARLPIIALSANAFAEDRERSLAAGMDAHIAKPVNIKELLGILSQFI